MKLISIPSLMINKSLKHIELLREHNISLTCPGMDVQEIDDIEFFRWYRSDWTHEDNFVPNLMEPRKPRNNIKEEAKCGYCGMSFWKDLDAAVKNFTKLSKNVQKLLGHSHVYSGLIQKSDGVGSLNDDHLNFYEYAEINLSVKFVEVQAFDVQ